MQQFNANIIDKFIFIFECQPLFEDGLKHFDDGSNHKVNDQNPSSAIK